MGSRVTIKDIARSTGTSVASVHRALHGGSGVGEDLRRRILEEAERSHYQIDESASLLRRNMIQITVLLPKPEKNERFYYGGLWQGITREAARLQKAKARIRMIGTDYGVDQFSHALEKLYDESAMMNEKIDGLVTICDDEESAAWITRFIRRGTAVALVDRSLPINGITCCAEVSVEDMGKTAMELAGLYSRGKGTPKDIRDGRRKIILINSSRHRSSTKVFSGAARKRLQEEWHADPPSLVEYHETEEARVRANLRSMLQDDPPEAVISASARATFWVCDEIARFYRENPGRIRERPPVIGTDLFPEQEEFFEDGTLKAVIYQSHLTSGEHCLSHLFDHLVGLDRSCGTILHQPLCIIMKDNYRSFLPDDLQKNKVIS